MHLEIAKQNGEIDILSHQKPDHRKRWGTRLISEPQSKDPNNIKRFLSIPTLNASVFIVTDWLVYKTSQGHGVEIYGS